MKALKLIIICSILLPALAYSAPQPINRNITDSVTQANVKTVSDIAIENHPGFFAVSNNSLSATSSANTLNRLANPNSQAGLSSPDEQ